jgi:hypothetical protein
MAIVSDILWWLACIGGKSNPDLTFKLGNTFTSEDRNSQSSLNKACPCDPTPETPVLKAFWAVLSQ